MNKFFARPLRKSFGGKPRRVVTAQDAVKIAKEMVTDFGKEHLIVLFMNAACICTGAEVISIGINDAVFADPKEVFLSAIMARSSNIFILHNHPSKELRLSENDIQNAFYMEACSKMVKIAVLDQIVFCQDDRWRSFTNGVVLPKSEKIKNSIGVSK